MQRFKSLKNETAANAAVSLLLIGLCSLNLAGSQTGSTYVHSLGCTVDFHFNVFDIRLPNLVTSSMRMAHIVSKVNSFITNRTFRHDRTSLE